MMIKTFVHSVCAITLLFSITVCSAQTSPDGVVGVGASEVPKAQLRLFVFPFDDSSPALVARAQVKGMEAPAVVASAPAGRSSAEPGYVDFPAGDGGYEVLAGDKPVATGPLRLAPNRAYTIVAWQGGDRAWQAKLFSDDSASSARAMRVLNFVPGRKSVVSAGEAEPAAVPAATVQEVQVPAKTLDIRAQVQDPAGGAPFQTSTAFDFSQAGSGYLLIAPDYRGKPDIRMVPGGFVTATAEVAAAASAPVAPPSASDIQKEAQQTRKRSLAYLKQALADLEALQAGPNPPPNADAIRRELQQQLKAVDQPAAPEPAPAAPRGAAAEAAR